MKKNVDFRREMFFTISSKIFTKRIIDELRTLFYKFEPQEGKRDSHLDENRRLFLTARSKKQTLVLKHAQKAPVKTDGEVQHHANRNGRFGTVLDDFLLPILAKRLIYREYPDDLA